jgi:Methyltransferase domain
MRQVLSKAVSYFMPRHVPASKQPAIRWSYPTLEQKHVENAKLFAGRENLLVHFAPRLKHGNVAEVGVMFGDFSEFIVRTIEPKRLIAIDRFDAHTYPTIWGKPSAETFKGKTHLEYYRQRLSASKAEILCEAGESWECLSRYPDQSFDMIYVDAGHDFESVKRDAEIAQQKIKPSGILIFNDYIKYSHFDDSFYGIIPAVNNLVANNGFEVVGFALQPDMYCDIAIRRSFEARTG